MYTARSSESTADTNPRARSIPACLDRKSTRLNSSHDQISYAVFCLKKKKTPENSRLERKSLGLNFCQDQSSHALFICNERLRHDSLISHTINDAVCLTPSTLHRSYT